MYSNFINLPCSRANKAEEARVLEALGSSGPLPVNPTLTNAPQESKKDVSSDSTIIQRIEHLEAENEALLKRIQVIQSAYSDLSKKVKALEEKSGINNSRRIIRPKTIK